MSEPTSTKTGPVRWCPFCRFEHTEHYEKCQGEGHVNSPWPKAAAPAAPAQPETRKHTMDCLSKGDASACPICKPINDAAFQRDRDELHKEQDQLLESEVNANQNRAKIRMSRYAVTHVRPDGTKIMLDVVQSTSLARAKRTFTKLHPIQAKNFRPFTVQEVA